jgi:hypothetical protein
MFLPVSADSSASVIESLVVDEFPRFQDLELKGLSGRI